MQQQSIWGWVFRARVSGWFHADGRATDPEAPRYPVAMRGSEFGCDARSHEERTDFEDTQAGSFCTSGAHIY